MDTNLRSHLSYASLLDGLESTAFLPMGGKSADANLLDGLDSTQLSPAGGDGRMADVA